MSDPSSAPLLNPGDQIGRFEILKLIKEGGQATVYLARVALADQPSAQRILWHLKWLGASPAWIQAQGICVIKLAASGKRDALIDEHSYLLQVRGALKPNEVPPHLVSLFSSPDLKTSDRQRGLDGIWDSSLQDASGRPLPYIALPYAPGGALDGLLKQRRYRPLPPATAIAITLQLCEALHFLHQRVDLVHHDISPSNIVLAQPLSAFLPRTPDCALIDLAAADSPGHPRLRTIFGKSTYLPPQRLTKTMGIIPAIDVYGLGVVLYELLVGQLPQPSTDQVTRLPNPLPPLRQQYPQLSQALGDLVMDTVSHDQRRWPSLATFQSRLANTPEAAASPALRGPLNGRAIVQMLVGLVAMLLLVLVITSTVIASTSSRPTISSTPTIGSLKVTPLPTAKPTMTPTLVPPTSTVVSSLPQPPNVPRIAVRPSP
jgi:serine/threonine protein kinase